MLALLVVRSVHGSSAEGVDQPGQLDRGSLQKEQQETRNATRLMLDENVPRERIAFSRCSSVTDERHHCLTVGQDGPALVGLESGTVCPLQSSVRAHELLDVSSIAWRREAMYVCAYPAGFLRISLIDGSAERLLIRCVAATDDGRNVLGMGPKSGRLFVYSSDAALRSDDPSASADMGLDTRMTAHGGRLYSAWHATETINVLDLSTYQKRSPIRLEGYHGWVHGLAVTDERELLIIGPTEGNRIQVFDLVTGAKRREIKLMARVQGLSCVTRD